MHAKLTKINNKENYGAEHQVFIKVKQEVGGEK